MNTHIFWGGGGGGRGSENDVTIIVGLSFNFVTSVELICIQYEETVCSNTDEIACFFTIEFRGKMKTQKNLTNNKTRVPWTTMAHLSEQQ